MPDRGTDHVPSWLGATVLLVSVCLVALGLFVADRAGQPASSKTSTFVPSDGHTSYARQQSRVAGRETVTTTITESALITGSAVTGALDWQLGAQLIGVVGTDSIRRARFWRTTTTTLDRAAAEGVIADQGQTTRVYRVGDAVSLLVESGPSLSYAYTPGLVELPIGAAPGASWQSEGTAGRGVSYTSTFHAEAATGSCLRVIGTIRYATVSTKAHLARKLTKTWCPRLGITNSSEREAGVELRSTPVQPDPIRSPPQTTDPQFNWTPTRWTEHRLTSTSADLGLGESPMGGVAAAVPPGATATGVMIRINNSGQDLIGFAPASARAWQSRWRAHPGGTVLTLSIFGNVEVVTTSSRQVLAYTDTGVRLWQLALDEVVMNKPSRASDTEAALVTVGGEVLVVDAVSGRVRWRTKPGSDIGLPPVVLAGVVVVADRGGTLFGLSAADGSELWQTEVTAPHFLVGNGRQLVVAQEGDLYGFDIGTGARLWRAGYLGNELGLGQFRDWVILNNGRGISAYDRAGRLAWGRVGVRGLTTDRSHLVCWELRKAEVLDASATTIQTFAIPDEPVGGTQRFVAASQGVFLLDSTWDFRGWSNG